MIKWDRLPKIVFNLPYVRLRPTINFARRGVPYRGSYCTAFGAPDKALVTTFYQANILVPGQRCQGTPQRRYFRVVPKM